MTSTDRAESFGERTLSAALRVAHLPNALTHQHLQTSVLSTGSQMMCDIMTILQATNLPLAGSRASGYLLSLSRLLLISFDMPFTHLFGRRPLP